MSGYKMVRRRKHFGSKLALFTLFSYSGYPLSSVLIFTSTTKK